MKIPSQHLYGRYSRCDENFFKSFFSVNNDCRDHDLCECDCVRTSCQNLDVKESEGKKTKQNEIHSVIIYSNSHVELY